MVDESTAREHLTSLTDMRMVMGTNADGETQYEPDPAYVRFREIRDLTADYGPDELQDFISEIRDSVGELRATHDVDGPGELRTAATAENVSPAESRELRRAAANWELYAYRLNLLEDAIARYDEFTRLSHSA